MTEFLIDHPQSADLADLMHIEHTGFTDEEAATDEAMANRINTINDTFFVARDADRKVIGFVNGPFISERYLTDDLFASVTTNPKTSGFQSILGIAVDPVHQNEGIATQLLDHLASTAKQHERLAVTLTCLDRLVPFYAKHGYQDEGISDSTHGGEVWHNMIKPL